MVSTKRVVTEDDEQLRRSKKSKRVKIKEDISASHSEKDNKSAQRLHKSIPPTCIDSAVDNDALSGAAAEKEATKIKRKLKKRKKEGKRSKAGGREKKEREIQVGSYEGSGEGSDDAQINSSAKESKKVLASRDNWRSVSRKYVQTMSLSTIPETEIRDFLSTHQITISDPGTKDSPLRPVTEFHHLPSTNFLEKRPSPFAQFRHPTPIQAVAWPYALSGRDLIGIAETGSGKTMAFALTCIEAVSAMGCRGTKAVIVSPTRELAMQTHKGLERLAALVKLRCVCLYGGASKEDQRVLLRRGCDIIVATPGRLKDLMSDNEVELSNAFYVVLDEADRMLDKGFEDDIKQILGRCPSRERRQTLMFTATWPQSVQTLASTFMINPVKIAIGVGGEETENGAVELKANPRINQKVEVLEAKDKEFRLLQIIQQRQQGTKRDDRILVFCLYKKEATRIESFLRRKGIRVGGIHGDLRQEQRTRSLLAFKTGTTPVLVATDVAARGLDIPEVRLVINITFPLTIEDYVHRIGRTGRAGNTGEAITMFTVQDKAHSGSLINVLKGANQPISKELLKFGTIVKKKTHDMYGSFFKEVDMTQKATKITFD